MSYSDFLKAFNPDMQIEVCKHKENAYFGEFPTLAKVNDSYGGTTSIQWLIPQLWNLAEYSGCKDKLTKNQILECASIIVDEFYYLKISEMMMFFKKFKSGIYGQFYGSVDPLKITTSLREFSEERNNIISAHEREVDARKREEYKKNAVKPEDVEKYVPERYKY